MSAERRINPVILYGTRGWGLTVDSKIVCGIVTDSVLSPGNPENRDGVRCVGAIPFQVVETCYVEAVQVYLTGLVFVHGLLGPSNTTSTFERILAGNSAQCQKPREGYEGKGHWGYKRF